MAQRNKDPVANAELRFPFSGPERLALIKSKWFLTDLNLFIDSGIAWSEGSKVSMGLNTADVDEETKRSPIFSTGASVRINLFGYLIIESYYAFPLQNGGFKNGQFGLSFVPGGNLNLERIMWHGFQIKAIRIFCLSQTHPYPSTTNPPCSLAPSLK